MLLPKNLTDEGSSSNGWVSPNLEEHSTDQNAVKDDLRHSLLRANYLIPY